MTLQTPHWRAPRVLTKDNWPPDYTHVFGWKKWKLEQMVRDPAMLRGALEFYKDHPVEFIMHWLYTEDPRNAFSDQLPVVLPFVLFQRQADLVEFLVACLTEQAPGLIDKSRDMGATWIAVAFSVWLWRFREGAAIGWGSRKEELVDRLGDPKSIFHKIRLAIRMLPRVLRPKGFDLSTHATYMKIINTENGATIVGEGGDNIGRGGRTLIYFVDEADHLAHPESVAAALGDNTNVEIDISTPNGVGTIFDRKREAGREWVRGEILPRSTTRVFTLDWSDHPEKDEEWHASRELNARNNGLLHVFRQEVDRDPAAALQGVIIPADWVKSAVDAHEKLGIQPTGGWCGALDVCDEGGDLHARSIRKGILLEECEDWAEGDTGAATRHMIDKIGSRLPIQVQYDCVGIGAGVKSEYNRLSKEKKKDGSNLLPHGMTFVPWDGGAAVLSPKSRLIQGDLNTPTNEDFYGNLKAQGWWSLRLRFERTHRMMTEANVKFPADQLISLSSKIPKLRQLMRELSQPVMKKSGDLKLIVDKKPEGARSPNMGDAVMMNYFPAKSAFIIPQGVVDAAGR